MRGVTCDKLVQRHFNKDSLQISPHQDEKDHIPDVFRTLQIHVVQYTPLALQKLDIITDCHKNSTGCLAAVRRSHLLDKISCKDISCSAE